MIGTETLVLSTKNVILRNFRKSDLQALHQVNSNQDVMQYIGGVKNSTDSRLFLDEILNEYQNGFGLKAVIYKPTMELAGYVGLSFHNTNDPEIKVVIHNKFQRKGLAKDTLKLCSSFAGDTLKFKSLETYIKSDNKPAKKALRKLNFKFKKIVYHKGKSQEMYTYSMSSKN
jgi:RimJ/RimL family protein N-acetyltransferase